MKRYLWAVMLALVSQAPLRAEAPIQSATGTGFSGSRSKGTLTFQSYQTDPFTGRASVSVPIAVPPGRQAIVPDLALQYFSTTANDWVGVGWNLNQGFIQRKTTRGIPRYDASDVFEASFSGVNAELVPIGGNEYRAKVEGAFMRFAFDGASWVVTDKSGTRYFFGQAGSSRQAHPSKGTFRWALDRIEDIHGNYLVVSYTQDQGQLYLSRIDYTGHVPSATPARASVEFVLEEGRSDRVISYRGGFRVVTDKRLKEIAARYNGDLVRKYALGYTQSPDTGKSLLASITQFGSDGLTSLPPMRFEYATSAGSFTSDGRWVIPDGAFVSDGHDQGRRLFDVNGDALPELLVAKSSPSDWYVAAYRNTGEGFVRDDGWKLPDGNFVFDQKDDGRRIADLNGDAFLDVIIATSWRDASGFVEVSAYRASYLNTGSGWVRDDRWLLPDGYFFVNQIASGQDRSSAQARHMVDVNGDGLADLLVGQGGTRRCYLNTGAGFTETGWCVPPVDLDASVQLADLNGDGLVDLAHAQAGTKATYLNTGSGWVQDAAFNIPDGDFIEGSGADGGRRLADLNGDGLPDLLIAKGGTKATYVNTGSGWISVGKWTVPDGEFVANDKDQGRWLSDIDADGLTDVVIAQDAVKTTYLNQGTVSDLLVRTTNGIGGATSIAYRPSSRYFNNDAQGRANLPFPMPTVAEVTIDDGMGNSYRTTYTYENGLFDWNEREFRGFGTVEVTDPEGNVSTTRFHQDAILKGSPQLQEFRNAAGTLLSRVFNTWQSTEVFSGVTFAALTSTDSYTFDLNGNFKLTQVDSTYDPYGNLQRVTSWGEVDPNQRGTRSGDEKEVFTEYVYNTTAWILDRPSHITMFDEQSRVVQERWLFYDQNPDWRSAPAKGLLTKEEGWLNPGSTNPTATFAYDQFGNLQSSTNALNRTTTSTYDLTDHIFPVTVTNPLGHTIQATYDPKTGQVLSQTDPNNVTAQNSYDVFGRLTQTSFTDPATGTQVVTAQYAYDLSSVPLATTTTVYTGLSLQGPLTSYQFADGLGRAIASASPAESSTQQVTGWTRYNFRGQPLESSNPYPRTTSASYSAPDLSQPKTASTYDALGRPTQITNPDGTARSFIYTLLWTTSAYDENNHRTNRTTDAYGRLIEVKEFNQTAVYTTRYRYDALGNLVQVTDAVGNVTTMAYDSLSRKLSMHDPDMGIWTYAYDVAGNLTSQTDARGVVTTFTYNDPLNRLTQKNYIVPAGSNIANPGTVTYTYDISVPAQLYSKGKLVKITDGSGSSSFEYDKLGRLIKESKTIDGSTSTIQRAYDLLGRLTAITYPDTEVVSYTYNSQGGMETIRGLKGGVTTTYVSNINYTAAGQLTKLAEGNGVTTDYTYDPQTLRLSSLRTQNAALSTLQDMSYSFDPVGNVATITDRVNTATQTFGYDNLHRLTSASGSYGSVTYRYDPIGNMTEKEGVTMAYGLADGSKPHAVTSVSGAPSALSSLSYDANGNLIEKRGRSGELIARYEYDVENRLVKVIPGPPVVEIRLTPGWNFFSVPIIPEPAELDTIIQNSGLSYLTDFDQISRYNPQTARFESYVADAKFNQFTQLEYGRGYLLYVTNASGATLRLTGRYPDAATTAPVFAGWNLLGHTRLQALALPLGLFNLTFGVDYDTVARYDKATGTWQFYPGVLSQLVPQEGYWVYGLRATSWQVPAQDPATRFVYDGDGGRVKQVSSSGTTTFLGASYEMAPDGTTTKYVFAGSQRIAAVAQSPQPSAPSLRFYHGDHLGSSNVITDGSGTLVELAEYTPYGSLNRREGPVNVPQKFTGKRLDPTGLYFYEARYYDPTLGRFITPDWFVPNPADPQDLNRYTYAGNNPLKYTDPTGHFKFKNLFKWIGRGLTFIGAFLMAPVNPIGASLLFWSGVTSFLPGRTWQTVSTSLAIASLAWSVGTGIVDATRQGGNWFTAGGGGLPQPGPNGPNWLVTGVNTTPEGAQAYAEISLKPGIELFGREGITPSVFQQGTHGVLSDVSEAASLKAFGGGRAARQLAGDLGKWAAQNKAVNLLLHSEGALIGKNALNIFSRSGQLVAGSRLWAFGSASFEGALRAAFLRAGGNTAYFKFLANSGDLVPALTANLNPLRTIYAAGATMLEGFREHAISTYYERAGGQ